MVILMIYSGSESHTESKTISHMNELKTRNTTSDSKTPQTVSWPSLQTVGTFSFGFVLLDVHVYYRLFFCSNAFWDIGFN